MASANHSRREGGRCGLWPLICLKLTHYRERARLCAEAEVNVRHALRVAGISR